MNDELSPLAQALGRFLAESCPDGLCGHFDDALLDQFPEAAPGAVKQALAELAAEGLVTLSPLIGPKLPRVRTTLELFIACDPAITGHDPVEDSVVLARLLVDQPDLGGNARTLEEAIGWDRRRFNPAFALLLPCIAERRVRTPLQDVYPAVGILLADEDVVALRRYVKAHSG